MNLQKAIIECKKGKLMTRAVWNNEQFIFMRPEAEIDVVTLVEKVMSLPLAVKQYYKDKIEEDDIKKGQYEVLFSEYLCIKTSTDTILNGWVPHPFDIMSNDWKEYKV